MAQFKDKVVLVTGSSSGIGAGIALEFAKQGAKVVISGRNVEALKNVAAELRKISPDGIEPLQVVGDFASEASLPDRLIKETVARFGKLDVLVNNAGVGASNDNVADPKVLEQFDKVFNLNVKSVLAMTHSAIPELEKTKGNIVNISSVASTNIVSSKIVVFVPNL